jgi:hypothetical protein
MSAAVSNPPLAKTHLRVLTNSELREGRACLRRHYFKYRIRRRPKRNAEALTFGTLWHVGQQAWWECKGEAVDRLDAGIEAMRRHVAKSETGDNPVNPFALVTVEELLLGYTARWADQTYRTIAIEKSFEVPLLNPETGHASRTFQLGGKFDGIVMCEKDELHVLEHKTSSADLEVGSFFWEKVRALDTQVSLYMAGAKASGYAVVDCIYDVVRKPGIKPLKATAEEDRKYVEPKSRACKECKKKAPAPGPHAELVGEVEVPCVDGRIVTDPGGRLYANMRAEDETPEEYRARLHSDIAERPDRYYARGTLVRLEEDERDSAFDTWQAARILADSEKANRAPRNPDSCSAFGGCDYLQVCTKQANINDDRLFRTAETSHEELQQEVG